MSDDQTAAFVREQVALMIQLGHAEYLPEDEHLPPEKRRLRLTELGEQYAEAFLGVER